MICRTRPMVRGLARPWPAGARSRYIRRDRDSREVGLEGHFAMWDGPLATASSAKPDWADSCRDRTGERPIPPLAREINGRQVRRNPRS